MNVVDVRVLSEAADDLETGSRFYDARDRGIGDEFWDSLLADIESLLMAASVEMQGIGQTMPRLGRQ